MSAPDSVSHWIRQLKDGDPAAAQPLWERYFQRLVGLARKTLRSTPRRAADEEDVALSAFHSFCQGAQHGRFPQLTDRDDLWQLLVVITTRKAYRSIKHENRKKRGGGKVKGESALPKADAATDEPDLAQIIGREPTPEFAAQAVEELQRLLASLGDDELRSIAVWKMEGYTNDEIAEKLGYVTVTIERRLRLIRTIWEKERTP
jgi:DNA-directed RNA polymerase specialized sigma24 family protein